jgi:hypothetical protein
VEVDGAGAAVVAEAAVVVLERVEEEEAEVRPGSEELVQLSRRVWEVVEGCGGCSTFVA